MNWNTFSILDAGAEIPGLEPTYFEHMTSFYLDYFRFDDLMNYLLPYVIENMLTCFSISKYDLCSMLCRTETNVTNTSDDLQRYSQSQWLFSYRQFPKKPLVGTPPRGCSPIDSFRVGMVEWWNSTRQIMEQPGTVRPAALWIALQISQNLESFSNQ